jgi:outer membrane protein assembly factor BamE (lipoprotein component of BamABCDE complex)
LQVGIALALCATLLGCIGATPLPKRTRTPTGTEAKDIDISFIHVGQTARAEVKEKLKLIDTGYEGEHFFLGRWSSSTWGGWYVLAGYYNAAAGGGRVWKSGNLLVQFDSAGVVTSSTLFDDAKAISILVPVAADTALQLASPLELQVKYYLWQAGNSWTLKLYCRRALSNLRNWVNGRRSKTFRCQRAKSCA